MTRTVKKWILLILTVALCVVFQSCAGAKTENPSDTASTQGQTAADISTNSENDTAQISQEQNVIHEKSKIEYDSVPILNITTESDEIDRNYISATVDFSYSVDGKIYEGSSLPAQIKLRGNSTSGGAKKPYSLRFDKKINLFGIAKGKKWTMLANFYDKSMLRNKLALDFAADLDSAFASECAYAAVTLNGRYVGLYLVCEPVSDGKNRTGIDTEKGEFIIEICPGDNLYEYTTNSGVQLRIDTPSEPTYQQYKNVYAILEEIDTAIISGNPEEYSKLIDVESFVNLYVLMEIFKDVDGYWKSLFLTYKNGKLYAGPAWDFDLSCGNLTKQGTHENYLSYYNRGSYGDGSGKSTHGLRMNHGWFKALLNVPEYYEAVCGRFRQALPLVESYCAEGGRFDYLRQFIAGAVEREYDSVENGGAGWDIAKGYSGLERKPSGDYNEEVEFLRSWLLERKEWLTEYFELGEPTTTE